MAKLHIKVEMNKGRIGIPLGKLATITEEIYEFLKMVCEDVSLESIAKNWLALDFANGSVSLRIENPEHVDDIPAARFTRTIERIMDFKLDRADDYSDINRRTLEQYARIGKCIDIDETVLFGIPEIYNPEADNVGAMQWKALSRQTSNQIEEYFDKPAKYEYCGGVQGTIYSLVKEVGRPYFILTTIDTEQKVKCFYKEHMYNQVINLLLEKDAIVNVSGMITANLADRKIEHIVAEKFIQSPKFSDDDFKEFFGCAPNLTGKSTTLEFIRKIRNAH